MFKTNNEDKDEDGNKVELPAKSTAEWKRRFLKDENGELQKERSFDWLMFELIAFDKQTISYPEALKMNLVDFLYIIRSSNKYKQLVNEKMSQVNGK